jgi:hypothetical protein
MRLGDILLRSGTIEATQLEAALAEQKQCGAPLGVILVRMGCLDEATLVRSLAFQLQLPVVQLRGKRVNDEVLELLPAELAEKHRCLPLLVNQQDGERVLYLGMQDPADLGAVEEIAARIEMPVRPVLVAPSELQEGLARHYSWARSELPPPPAGPDPGLLGALGPAGDPDLSFGGEELAAHPGGDAAPGEPLDASGAVGGLPDFDPDADLSFGEELPSFPDAEDPATTPAPAPRPRSGAVSSDAMLRALAQLLVEKGVISREELVARLHRVAGGGDS